ncbi:ADP-ribosylation factor-like protein 6-interacting protein 4 [Bulinus truncatus]|nr:ADP-ribosylation factor-like protein 6-interacting protein 4 [Bulinus truncatus]
MDVIPITRKSRPKSKTRKKRRHSSTSENSDDSSSLSSSSSSSSDSSTHRSKKRKKSHSRSKSKKDSSKKRSKSSKSKKKDKRSRSSSSESSSRRKKMKKRKKSKKEKSKLKTETKVVATGLEFSNSVKVQQPALEDVPSGRKAGPKPRIMKPMTKEEWEKQQSIIRRVIDEETGRERLIKGDGEILEEIVSRNRHVEINKMATKGDGEYFAKQMGLL